MTDFDSPVVSCQNILKLPECKSLRLIAGSSGAHRRILWVHYIEEESYIRFVKGKELILTTGILLHSRDEYLSFITALNKKKVSGIVINEQPDGGIPYQEDIVALGDRLELPIFSLPFYCRFEDISQAVCREVFLCEQQSYGREKVLFDLFFGSAEEVRTAGSRLSRYGFDFSRPLCSAVMRVESVSLLSGAAASTGLKCYFEYCQEYFHREIVFTQHGSEIALLFPVGAAEQKEDVRRMLRTMVKEVSALLGNVSVFVGLSSIWTGQDALADNLNHARYMAALCVGAGCELMDYDDSGAFRLILSLDRRTVLERYYAAAVAPLQESDRAHCTDYLNTLLAYLKNGCDLQKTASALFIHYNTLRYRLRAIEKLLGKDFRVARDVSDAMLLWHIKQYLDCSGLI